MNCLIIIFDAIQTLLQIKLLATLLKDGEQSFVTLLNKNVNASAVQDDWNMLPFKVFKRASVNSVRQCIFVVRELRHDYGTINAELFPRI